MFRKAFYAVTVTLVLTACGGHELPPVSSCTPELKCIQLVTSETSTFLTTIAGGVTWSIQEGVAGGTITATGLYTAPKTPGTYHVVATSNANPNVKEVFTVVICGVTKIVVDCVTWGDFDLACLGTGAYAPPVYTDLTCHPPDSYDAQNNPVFKVWTCQRVRYHAVVDTTCGTQVTQETTYTVGQP